MALVEHLRELRNRLGISLLALAVCVVVAFFLREDIFDLLKRPYCQTDVAARAAERSGDQCTLFAFGTFEQFSVSLRVSLIAGVITSRLCGSTSSAPSSPRRCIARRSATPRPSSAPPLVLFVVGAVFAFFTISRGLQFLLSVGGGGDHEHAALDPELPVVRHPDAAGVRGGVPVPGDRAVPELRRRLPRPG